MSQPQHTPATSPQLPNRIAAAPVQRRYIVVDGVPQDGITPAEFAERVGLSRDSVYRYVGTNALPDHLVIRAGKRKLIIAQSAVVHFLEHWRAVRGSS